MVLQQHEAVFSIHRRQRRGLSRHKEGDAQTWSVQKSGGVLGFITGVATAYEKKNVKVSGVSDRQGRGGRTLGIAYLAQLLVRRACGAQVALEGRTAGGGARGWSRRTGCLADHVDIPVHACARAGEVIRRRGSQSGRGQQKQRGAPGSSGERRHRRRKTRNLVRKVG